MTASGTHRPSGPFREGDRVQLTGPKGRLHTVTLREDGELHTHHGVLRHRDLIGLPDGSVAANSSGHEYLALRPLLKDFAMSMPRGAAIVYPKDAAQIVMQADVFPGATVVEAGVGSGALSLSLLRAVGPAGRLVSFERREDFAEVARGNVATFFGEQPDTWSVVVGDLVEQLPSELPAGSVDRVVLDMLAPWECIDVVADALTPGEWCSATSRPPRSSRASRSTSATPDCSRIRTPRRRWCAAGTSRASRCVPITGWSRTPASC